MVVRRGLFDASGPFCHRTSAANDVKEMFSMWLRLVGGCRAVGAFAVCLRAREGATPWQRFPSRGQTRGADSADALHRLRARNVIRTKNHARVVRDLPMT
jgi:hypothetical protein